jgi:hypothetical protein
LREDILEGNYDFNFRHGEFEGLVEPQIEMDN